MKYILYLFLHTKIPYSADFIYENRCPFKNVHFYNDDFFPQCTPFVCYILWFYDETIQQYEWNIFNLSINSILSLS